MTTSFLRYRVGSRARQRIQDKGLDAHQIAALVGPASGPKWLALVGIDQALLSSGLLRRRGDGPPIQLLGASAGSWRMLAYATQRPLESLQRLQDGYIGQVFTRLDKAPYVSQCYRQLMHDVVGEHGDHVLRHSDFDLSILTTRLRRGRSLAAMTASLVGAAALQTATRRATGWFFERVLFHRAPQRAKAPVGGKLAALTQDNLCEAALASGSVPYYLSSIEDLPGAPRGLYVDGGLTDYHLHPASMQPWDGVVLLPHYWRRVVPQWLDKGRPRRDLTAQEATDVLQIYPSQEFIASLPGGHLPDREDFKTFVDDPDERIRRWREVTQRSQALGEELQDDLASGRWLDKLEDWSSTETRENTP